MDACLRRHDNYEIIYLTMYLVFGGLSLKIKSELTTAEPE
jgi:hypothetical protein